MSNCPVCDSELTPEQKTCHLCGSSLETATSSAQPDSTTAITMQPPRAPDLDTSTQTSISGERECHQCGRTFNADYHDEFCSCGAELKSRIRAAETSSDGKAEPQPVPPQEVQLPPSQAGATRPAVGTICLVVYSDSKPRQPVLYAPIVKDVFLIGRLDAVRGDFPDLDLGGLLDESLSKKISRRHAEVLRARDSQTYSLRPSPGNTGTQIGKELASPNQHYPLNDGTPIVLGGVVWMKFEIIK